MNEPQLLVSPYLAVYQLRGDISLQSEPSPGVIQDNAPTSMRTFGQDHYREDIGVRIDFGDGFGGLRIDYYQLDQNTTDSGVLTADYGALPAGDVVRMNVDMDEVRIGYLEPLYRLKTMWHDRPFALSCAGGVVFAHREMDLRAASLVSARQQKVEIEGDVVYPAVRVSIGWRDFGFDADYAISPDLSLGGDFAGTLQDLELRATYALPLRNPSTCDVKFFGGWRYSTLPAEGTEGNLAFDSDLVLDGFQLGVTVTF